MRILCLDIPAPGASLEKYAPHLNAEALHAWGLYKSGFIRDIYFRQDRPGVAIFLECDSVDEAMNVMAEFPLAKAGLLSFECIPLGSFINWENLFADEFKNKSTAADRKTNRRHEKNGSRKECQRGTDSHRMGYCERYPSPRWCD